MAENEEWTCGKGVAENAKLPERMGAVLKSVADVLHNHIRSLSTDDVNGREEIAAYEHLVREHRAAANLLLALAGAMRSYRDLPMAEHDMAKLMDPASVDAMAAFVRAEEDALALLQQRVQEHNEMLKQMRG